MEAIGGIFVLLGLVSLAAVIKPFGPFKKRWQALVAWIVLWGIGGALLPPAPTTNATAPASQVSAATGDAAPGVAVEAPAEPAAAPSRWRYDTQRDEMRNASTHLACIESTNELRFDFPYQGGSTAQICFRQSPQHGLDAWVRINPGQFTCVLDCTVRAKFDDGEIQTFSAGGSSDGSADIVFISNYDRFLRSARGATRIVIEADFFQYGSQQMIFENTSGLEWPRES